MKHTIRNSRWIPSLLVGLLWFGGSAQEYSDLRFQRLSSENLKLEKGLLLVSGKMPESDTEETWLQREFGLDAFERSFRLPDMADLEQITATYADGVLQVRIGKRGDRQRRIDIS